MADTVPVTTSPVPAAASPTAKVVKQKLQTGKKKGDGKPKTSTHPPVSDMIVAALKSLKERNGSSLQAIKKHIAANFMCDVAKLAPFLKKALKSGVEKGKFTQTKGTGASGRFKMNIHTAKDKPSNEQKQSKKAAEKQQQKKDIGKKKLATGGDKTAVAKKVAKTSGKSSSSVDKSAKKKPAISKQKSTKPSAEAKKPKAPKSKKAIPAASSKKTAAKK